MLTTGMMIHSRTKHSSAVTWTLNGCKNPLKMSDVCVHITITKHTRDVRAHKTRIYSKLIYM